MILWIGLLAIALAASWFAAWLARVAEVGSGYKARALASVLFGAGRKVDPNRAEEVSADSYWPMRLLRANVDPARRSVTVSLFGLRPRTALNDSLTGTVLLGSDNRVPEAIALERYSSPFVEQSIHPWQTRSSAAVQAVVDAAFQEPNPKRLRRTRAIVVVHDGELVCERYAPGFDEDTSFPGWSMTKSVLGALVGVLVGEGRLALDQRELLPAWRLPDARGAITLEDLLRMRSGLSFTEVYEDLSSDVVEMLFVQPDAASYAATRPLKHLPGTVWDYSSGTTNIISGIVRHVLGEAEYARLPRRALFGPLGMTSAILERDAAGTYVGSSFMMATARDWARFGQLYLDDGVWRSRRILPQGWVEFSRTTTPQSTDGIYGAHWWLGLKPELGGGGGEAARLPPDAFFAVGHEGQVLTVIPSRRLVVVRLGLSIYIDAWDHVAFLNALLDAL
jgi:CubicO group peptidase (beta-lactamase class C family)